MPQFIIQLSPGLYVAKEGRRFTGAVSDLNLAFHFRSRLAARIVRRTHGGTIQLISNVSNCSGCQ